MLAIANQTPGAAERYGLSREELDRSAWAIEPGGRRFEGAAAMNRTFQELGPAWRALAVAYRLKPAAAIEEAGYRWFSRNRSRFDRLGVAPECDEPDAPRAGKG